MYQSVESNQKASIVNPWSFGATTTQPNECLDDKVNPIYPNSYAQTSVSVPVNTMQYNTHQFPYHTQYANYNAFNNFNQHTTGYTSYQNSPDCNNTVNHVEQISLVKKQPMQAIAEISQTKSSEVEEEDKENDDSSNQASEICANYPVYFTTQKINPNTAKLSYTMFQKNLLESVYLTMRYPNSDQKTILSQRLGITRDQLKIWFQNRRRKDVLVPTKASKRKASDDDFDVINNFDSEIVSAPSPSQSPEQASKPPSEDQVKEKISIDNVLSELKSFENGPSRLIKKSKCNKKSKSSSSDEKSFNKGSSMPCAEYERVSGQAEYERVSGQAVLASRSSITTLPSSNCSSMSSSSSYSSSEEEKSMQQATIQVNSSINNFFDFNRITQAYSITDYVNNMKAHGIPSFKYPKNINFPDANSYATNETQTPYYYPTPSAQLTEEWHAPNSFSSAAYSIHTPQRVDSSAYQYSTQDYCSSKYYYNNVDQNGQNYY